MLTCDSPNSALLRKNDKGHGEIKSLSPLLPIDDIRLFLSEQCRTLDEKIHEVVANFPPYESTSSVTSSTEATLVSLFSQSSCSLITSAEATLFLLFSHSASITDYYIDGLQAIEQSTVEMLTKACGREVTQKDFDNFVKYNNEKLFCDGAYRPMPFSVDIRRPNRVPEGIIKIEMSMNGGSTASDCEETWPINTITKEVTLVPDKDGEDPGVQIRIPSIATMARISGKSYVHGWLTHQFADKRDFRYHLSITSRQFSSFIVLTGTISHNQCMDVKNAIIVENKHEVVIPLNLVRARAVGDFPGLVSSLSPQQQSFAQTAREVQLESSVFAVCVVEIKPQLELLLGLPVNSLTKEVKLVKDLMSLFVDHQLSADLVSYEGPNDASVQEKISAVKHHVEIALEMAHNIPSEENEEVLSAEVSAEDIIEEPRPNNPFQRGNALKESRGSNFSVTSGSRVDRGEC